jgi:hypothetical protein
MPTLTVSSSLTRDEVAKVLAGKLGPGIPVRPGRDADSVRVGKVPLRAKVEVLAGDGATTIKIIPWGLTLFRSINSLGIARKIETALEQSEFRST